MTHEDFMKEAIKLSVENVEKGGGPFGAVIVKDGKIVGKGANSVTSHNDPTAHAEIMAIRNAAKELGTFDLSECTIYTSCEPCPMCLGAVYWARLSKMYYGNTKTDAAKIGFDDAFIYKEMELPLEKRSIPAKQLLHDEAYIAFKMWEENPDKIEY
ncbi:MAG: nucleoside deaminase [Chlorobi bacterium]|nr:nucleoside deaminase [Chlorobiota bacterium]